MNMLKAISKLGSSSRDVAKERLKLILVHDRTNIPPQFLDMIKGDLIRVISDYAEVDEHGIEITVSTGEKGKGDENISALIASIPIKKVKNIGR